MGRGGGAHPVRNGPIGHFAGAFHDPGLKATICGDLGP
jgi:hypothetical protein